MVSEARELTLNLSDLTELFRLESEHWGASASQGTVSNIRFEDQSNEVLVEFVLKGDRHSVVRSKVENLVAGFIRFCKSKKIPLPLNGRKTMYIHRDHVQIVLKLPANGQGAWAVSAGADPH